MNFTLEKLITIIVLEEDLFCAWYFINTVIFIFDN